LGVRRNQPINTNPAPGDYCPEKADQLIFTTAPIADFSKLTKRNYDN